MTSLASISTQLTDFVGNHGVYAVFLLMAIDAVFPAGSEVVMLYAGALASGSLGQTATFLGTSLHGFGAYVVLALAGTLGYLVGAIIGWGIGRRGGTELVERRGRWLHLGPDRLERAKVWFGRHGSWAVFLGRITPIVRSFISIPACVLGSPFARYTVLTLAGSAIWCFAFAGAGWALGSSYDKLDHSFRYVDYAVIALVIVGVAVLLVRRRRSRAQNGTAPARAKE